MKRKAFHGLDELRDQVRKAMTESLNATAESAGIATHTLIDFLDGTTVPHRRTILKLQAFVGSISPPVENRGKRRTLRADRDHGVELVRRFLDASRSEKQRARRLDDVIEDLR